MESHCLFRVGFSSLIKKKKHFKNKAIKLALNTNVQSAGCFELTTILNYACKKRNVDYVFLFLTKTCIHALRERTLESTVREFNAKSKLSNIAKKCPVDVLNFGQIMINCFSASKNCEYHQLR